MSPGNDRSPAPGGMQGHDESRGQRDNASVNLSADSATIRAEMTARDRAALVDLTKARARVAKQQVAVREAELRAEVEAQLSVIWSAEDEAWTEVVQQAQALAAEADRRIAEVAAARGIADELRPRYRASFFSRSATPSRRVELRKAAFAHIEAAGRAAKVAIDRHALETQTALIAGGLSSDDARACLEELPTVEALMPPIDVRALPGGAK